VMDMSPYGGDGTTMGAQGGTLVRRRDRCETVG
jgi:hypothetical protein